MNTTSQQAEQTAVEPEATRDRTTRKYGGRAALAVVTIAIGTALTALVIGVTGGTEAQAPPSPGFVPPYGDEVPPQGLDQRLYNLAEEYAEKHSEVPPQGVDQRLYELADQFAEKHSEVPPQGVDQRLYELADQFAARQRAQQD